MIKSDFKSDIDENTKIYSIIRKLPKQIIENSLEITVNKTVKTIHMRTISGPIPFTYHYKMVSFRGTTIVILNAEINKPIINVWKMKHIPRILLKNMLLKEINRNLYSLKIDLEKIYKIDETTGVI